MPLNKETKPNQRECKIQIALCRIQTQVSGYIYYADNNHKLSVSMQENLLMG